MQFTAHIDLLANLCNYKFELCLVDLYYCFVWPASFNLILGALIKRWLLEAEKGMVVQSWDPEDDKFFIPFFAPVHSTHSSFPPILIKDLCRRLYFEGECFFHS